MSTDDTTRPGLLTGLPRGLRLLIPLQLVTFVIFVAGGVLLILAFAQNSQPSVGCLRGDASRCEPPSSYLVPLALLAFGILGLIGVTSLASYLGLKAGPNGAVSLFSRGHRRGQNPTSVQPPGTASPLAAELPGSAGGPPPPGEARRRAPYPGGMWANCSLARRPATAGPLTIKTTPRVMRAAASPTAGVRPCPRISHPSTRATTGLT